MTRRTPIVYTEETPPPLARGVVRDIWARLAARLPRFKLWWDGESFRAEAEGQSRRISQHIAIAVDEIDGIWPHNRQPGSPGPSPAVAEAAAVLGRGWLTLQQVATALQISRSAAQERLRRAEEMGMVETTEASNGPDVRGRRRLMWRRTSREATS
jgi:DNA-binding transcriptional ArsR family regulator